MPNPIEMSAIVAFVFIVFWRLGYRPLDAVSRHMALVRIDAVKHVRCLACVYLILAVLMVAAAVAEMLDGEATMWETLGAAGGAVAVPGSFGVGLWRQRDWAVSSWLGYGISFLVAATGFPFAFLSAYTIIVLLKHRSLDLGSPQGERRHHMDSPQGHAQDSTRRPGGPPPVPKRKTYTSTHPPTPGIRSASGLATAPVAARVTPQEGNRRAGSQLASVLLVILTIAGIHVFEKHKEERAAAGAEGLAERALISIKGEWSRVPELADMEVTDLSLSYAGAFGNGNVGMYHLYHGDLRVSLFGAPVSFPVTVESSLVYTIENLRSADRCRSLTWRIRRPSNPNKARSMRSGATDYELPDLRELALRPEEQPCEPDVLAFIHRARCLSAYQSGVQNPVPFSADVKRRLEELAARAVEDHDAKRPKKDQFETQAQYRQRCAEHDVWAREDSLKRLQEAGYGRPSFFQITDCQISRPIDPPVLTYSADKQEYRFEVFWRSPLRLPRGKWGFLEHPALRAPLIDFFGREFSNLHGECVAVSGLAMPLAVAEARKLANSVFPDGKVRSSLVAADYVFAIVPTTSECERFRVCPVKLTLRRR